jgi:hypothetical protein
MNEINKEIPKKTVIQELIDEIVEHLTYDDDLTDESRNTLEAIRLRCLGKLTKEKEQIKDAYYSGTQHEYNDSESFKHSDDYYEKMYGK